jgi:asparagine synthase (glutamine-hydrolysing)
VIFSGEGSDELSGSYMYFHNAPSDQAYQQECVRLCNDLHRYDVLRADMATACAGIEVRVPFLDKDFVEYYMKIPPQFRKPREGLEKYLLRKAFDDSKLLPREILYRVKEAFSDGVSSTKDSWYSFIQRQELNIVKKSYTYCPPQFLEAEYYRQIFQKMYKGRDSVIPYYWIPKWNGNIKEPSARVLQVYSQ